MFNYLNLLITHTMNHADNFMIIIVVDRHISYR